MTTPKPKPLADQVKALRSQVALCKELAQATERTPANADTKAAFERARDNYIEMLRLAVVAWCDEQSVPSFATPAERAKFPWMFG